MESYIDLFANIFDFNWGTEPGEISALEIPNYIFFTTFCEEMLLKNKEAVSQTCSEDVCTAFLEI